MDEALIELLTSDAALAALVGDGDRIYWDEIGQGKASPAVVLYKISGIVDYHHGGQSGLVESRVQIDCRGVDKGSSLATARAVEAVLSGFRGIVGAVRFGSILKDSERSRFDRTEAERFFIVSADYIIWNGSAV